VGTKRVGEGRHVLIGRLVVMDLPTQSRYKEVGVVIVVNKPRLFYDFGPKSKRITYDILVGEEVLCNQLYEYFYELD
jgi:hypothetical protein